MEILDLFDNGNHQKIQDYLLQNIKYLIFTKPNININTFEYFLKYGILFLSRYNDSFVSKIINGIEKNSKNAKFPSLVASLKNKRLCSNSYHIISISNFGLELTSEQYSPFNFFGDFISVCASDYFLCTLDLTLNMIVWRCIYGRYILHKITDRQVISCQVCNRTIFCIDVSNNLYIYYREKEILFDGGFLYLNIENNIVSSKKQNGEIYRFQYFPEYSVYQDDEFLRKSRIS